MKHGQSSGQTVIQEALRKLRRAVRAKMHVFASRDVANVSWAMVPLLSTMVGEWTDSGLTWTNILPRKKETGCQL